MPAARRENRGPNAAAANRHALLSAAREVFADAGFDAPLSAVTRKAGVGQGSLYRHFPDRVSLAIAVFEDDVAELEDMAENPASTLDDLLGLITARTTGSMAFVEVVTPARDDPRMVAVVERVEAAVATVLHRAHRSGAVRDSLRTKDVMLAVSLVAALVAKTPQDQRRRTADHAWSLLWQALRP